MLKQYPLWLVGVLGLADPMWWPTASMTGFNDIPSRGTQADWAEAPPLFDVA
jgi:hypothetical protein